MLVSFVSYYSYFAILYSCYNICNSCSYCGHAVNLARNAFARMRLYWDGSISAQTSLKCILFRPAPTLLSQIHGLQYSRINQSPNNMKRPTTPWKGKAILDINNTDKDSILRSIMEWVSFWKINGMGLNPVLLILSKMRKVK